jgi:hypothetical protein
VIRIVSRKGFGSSSSIIECWKAEMLEDVVLKCGPCPHFVIQKLAIELSWSFLKEKA